MVHWWMFAHLANWFSHSMDFRWCLEFRAIRNSLIPHVSSWHIWVIRKFPQTGGIHHQFFQNWGWHEKSGWKHYLGWKNQGIKLGDRAHIKNLLQDWFIVVIIVILRKEHCKSKRWPSIKKDFTHTPSRPTLQRLQ